MKILVVGDFHGRFPDKFVNLIKKEKIDLVVSNGDYLPFLYRKLWFEHCYGKDVELWEVIGKKRYKEFVNKDLKIGEQVLKKLNKLDVPVFSVLGNVDYPSHDDVSDNKKRRGKKFWKWDFERNFHFAKLIAKYKNIKRFDYSFAEFGEYVFIGANTGSFPGRVKSKAYKKSRRKLDSLFRRFRSENKERRVIFASHNVPYKTKLDIFIGKKAVKSARGKHYGSKLVRRIIDRHQPVLHIGGHIHKSRGMQKLGKTLCINPGALREGHYAIVEIDGKMKVRFGR